jgi:hypothetical protein
MRRRMFALAAAPGHEFVEAVDDEGEVLRRL